MIKKRVRLEVIVLLKNKTKNRIERNQREWISFEYMTIDVLRHGWNDLKPLSDVKG